MQINEVVRSMLLLESAKLTDHEEQWVLQTVAGNYAAYPQIRAALRRTPSMAISGRWRLIRLRRL